MRCPEEMMTLEILVDGVWSVVQDMGALEPGDIIRFKHPNGSEAHEGWPFVVHAVPHLEVTRGAGAPQGISRQVVS